MSKRYDAIIIGAGIGGLTCGTRLAQNGLKVLIVEKHDKVGGCVTSCRKKGFHFDYGAHLVGSCDKNGILSYYLKELCLGGVSFIKLDPYARFFFPDDRIEVPQDFEAYAALLKERFRDEAHAIDLFFDEVVRIGRSYSSERIFRRYKDLTFAALLRRHFASERLASILAAPFRYLATPLDRLAAAPMCLMMMSYFRDGTYYPVGGMQAFSDAFAASFVRYGGTLALKNECTKIIMRDGRAAGIETDRGDAYEAAAVVSNTHPVRTFAALGHAGSRTSAFVKRLRALKTASSFFMTFLGVRDLPGIAAAAGWHHFGYGFDLKPRDSFYLFVPSMFDQSLAPAGRHTAMLSIPFPYRYDDVRDWDLCKHDLEAETLALADRVVPGIRGAVEYKESATPRTLERFTCNANGSIAGFEMSVAQIGEGRPGCLTPVDGLYLTGHWTNPGCGVVPVVTSGWIAAHAIMERMAERSTAVSV